MDLSKVLFKQGSFDFLQQFQKLFFSTIFNILVINFIPRENYALFGIAAGYFVFLQWLAFSPETILIQQYKSIRENDWSNYLSTISMFSWIRSLIIFITSLILSIIVYKISKNIYLSSTIILYAINQSLVFTSGGFQFILKMSLRQNKITLYSFFINIFKIISIFILFIYSNVLAYISLMIVFSILEIICWLYILKKEINFSLLFSVKETLLKTKNYLISFSLWQQLSGVFTKSIYQVDTFFLSIVGVSLLSIGNYTVALQIANLVFIIPNLLQSNLAIWLSRVNSKEKENYITNLYLKYSFFMSIFQLILFIIFGKFYVLLHSREDLDEIYLLSLIIIIGASVINIFRPLISLANSKLDIKKLLVSSYIPTIIFSFTAYFLLSKAFGAFGAAYANILVYSFWSATLVYFIKKNGYRPKISIKITKKEIDFLKYVYLLIKNKYISNR